MTAIAYSTGQHQIHERWFVILWVLVTTWLLISALLIRGEYGDGYQTIVNARYLFGNSADYYVQRGPLAAFALWPVEVIAGVLNVNAVDVRPYHLYSALLHSCYLLGCWLLLKRTGELFIARVIAFTAAILSVVFFANAPYLSHDLIPGLLFLLLIFLCHRWLGKPTLNLSLQLLLVGTAVTLIKQTYAVFWIALCAYALVAFMLRWHDGRLSLQRVLSLFVLAGFSGLLSWITYGWFIGAEIPEVALLARPLALVNSVSLQYETDGGISGLFPWDMYLRNLHNYGIATSLLVIPGVVLAFRGEDTRMRMIASSWVVGVVILQAIDFKEVRYLAFLAPLSALLIAPVVTRLMQSQVLFLVLLAVVLVDQYRGWTMAAGQLTAQTGMDVDRFVGEASADAKFIASEPLSFTIMADSPFWRDRYQGIFHLTADHLFRLNEGRVDVLKLTDPRDLGIAGITPGDRVLFSNRTVVRRPPWGEDNVPFGLEQLVMVAGNAAMIKLIRAGDQYSIDGYDGRFVMFVPPVESSKQMPLITTSPIPTERARVLQNDPLGDSLEVLGVVADTICQADRCTHFE